jgi:hypothetical protein
MKLAITALVVALVASSAMASSYLWNGSVSSQWIIAGNWTPIDGGTSFPQTGGDNAIFFDSASVTTTGLVALPNVNITGTLSLTVPSGTLSSPNGTVISGPGALKVAAGLIRFNQGAAPNTFAGGLEVANGAKILLSGGDQIVPAGGLTLDGSATNLQMMSGDRIVDTCPLIFNGPTPGTGDPQINWSDVSETLGVIRLQASGSMNALNFGGGDACNIHFADSSAVDWSTGGKLVIKYLAGTNLDNAGNIYVGNSASGLTPAQLAKVSFAEMSNSTWSDDGNYYPAAIAADGRLYPVPEPMTLSLLLVGGIAGLIRRRR